MGGEGQSPGQDNKTFLILKGAVGVILLAMVLSGALYFAAGIGVHQFLPTHPLCLFRNLFSLPCPGCGMTRAVLAVGQLRWGAAWEFNPLVFPFLLLCLFYFYSNRKDFQARMKLHHLDWFALVAVMGFWGWRIWTLPPGII
jgi:hypothetical protein